MKKIGNVIINIVFVLTLSIFCVVAFSLLPIENNYKIFIVKSGSMEPVLRTGSVILVQPKERYLVDDVVTRHMGGGGTVTHRIIEEIYDDELLMYRTKGDANDVADFKLVSSSSIFGKVAFTVPYVGYSVSFIKTPLGLLLCIIIPSVIFIIWQIMKIADEVQKIKIKKRQKKSIEERDEFMAKKLVEHDVEREPHSFVHKSKKNK